MATLVLYGAYAVIELCAWVTSALLVVHPSARRLWRGWWLVPFRSDAHRDHGAKPVAHPRSGDGDDVGAARPSPR